MGLGRVIRKYREGRNLTQERLAGAAGIDLRTMQRAESGQGIGKENLTAIANAIDLDEEQLLKLATQSGPPPAEKRITLKLVKSGREPQSRSWWPGRFINFAADNLTDAFQSLDAIQGKRQSFSLGSFYGASNTT